MALFDRTMLTRERMGPFVKGIAVGLICGTLASLAGLPLPWMLGPLVGAAAVSLAGVKLAMPEPIRFAFRGVVGILLGAALDQEVIARIGQWPISMLLIVVGMAVIVTLVSFYYRHVARFDALTSVAACLPGGISSITVIAIQLGAEPTRTVVSQLLRVSLVVLVVPPLYWFWQGAGPDAPLLAARPSDWLGSGLWALLVAPPAWYLAARCRLPVPEMTGPMIAAAALTLSGVRIDLPAWLFAVTFLVLGTAIGTRFYGMGDVRKLLGLAGHGLVATCLMFAGSFLLALCIHWAIDVPLPVALLAVVPGGIAEMAVLAAALGVDPVFVVFHQLMRSVLLNALAPLLLRWVGKRWGSA